MKCGGVFGHSKMLDDLLDSVLVSGALRAKISRLEISPAVGAARIAARVRSSPRKPASMAREDLPSEFRPRSRRPIDPSPRS